MKEAEGKLISGYKADQCLAGSRQVRGTKCREAKGALWGVDNVLHVDCGGGYISVHICQNLDSTF